LRLRTTGKSGEFYTPRAVTQFITDIVNPKEGEKIMLSVSTLVNNEIMLDLSNYVKVGVECDGQIAVSRVDKEYKYVAFLDCGKDFSEMALSDAFDENTKIVTSGDGLYLIGEDKVFRGEPKDNYVMFEKSLWRISKIDKSNNMTAIFETTRDEDKRYVYENQFVWDDRFNNDIMEYLGINNFEMSRIRETVIEMATNTNIIPKGLLEKMMKKNLCIGSRDVISTAKDNSVECSKLSAEKYYIGSITPSDFMQVSIDENCIDSGSKSCGNYNYLTDSIYSYWTYTASTETTYSAYSIQNGGLNGISTNSYLIIRPVIYLDDTVVKVSGSGTYTDPYVIK